MPIVKLECLSEVFECSVGGFSGVKLFDPLMLYPDSGCRHTPQELAQLVVNNDAIDSIGAG